MSPQNPTETEESDEAIATHREAREYARGRLDVEHGDVYEWSGLVHDPQVRQVLAFAKQEYEPREGMPPRFEETEFFHAAMKKYATEAATEAIYEGNVSQTAYLSGLPSYKSDISGLHAINRLADWLVSSEQCKLIYAAALMGRGKTDFSLLLFEIIADHYARIRRHAPDAAPRPEFATNFYARPPDDADVDVHEFHRYSEFMEWAEGGNSDMERWFIFDEASTELTAQSGANAQEVAERFAPFVKKMRKLGINMIVIGHDRGDVHPAIRSIASFIDKTGRKTAEIYEGIKSREPYGHHLSVSGIPATSWEFDTDDVASWTWDADVVDDVDRDDDRIDEEEWQAWRDERMAAIYAETDLSWRDVGRLFGVSRSTARRRSQEVEPSVEPAPENPKAMGD